MANFPHRVTSRSLTLNPSPWSPLTTLAGPVTLLPAGLRPPTNACGRAEAIHVGLSCRFLHVIGIPVPLDPSRSPRHPAEAGRAMAGCHRS